MGWGGGAKGYMTGREEREWERKDRRKGNKEEREITQSTFKSKIQMLPLKHTWLQANSKTKAIVQKWNKNHEASRDLVVVELVSKNCHNNLM